MLRQVLTVALMIGLAGGTAFGFSVSADGDRNLNGGANLVADAAAETISPTGTGTSADPYVYDWGDIDGVGTDATDNLVLGGSKLHNSDNTCFALKLENANGKGTITGTGTLAFETTRLTIAGKEYSGSVTIAKVGDISMGGISTAITAGGNYKYTGSITVGESGDPAGNVRVDYLDTHGATYGPTCGAITVYSSGDVKVEDASANAGDILGYGEKGGKSSVINIQHDGAFKARDIQDYLGGAWTGGERMGSFTAEGDAGGDGASGPFECRDINQYFTYWSYRGNVGFVDISGYTSVHISGDIDTHSTATGSTISKYASDVTIEDIEGDILIAGACDLQGNTGGTPPDPQYNGVLTLKTTGSTISLGELDCDKVRQAIFENASGDNYVYALLNFNTADPLNCNIVAPEQLVWYDSALSGMSGIYHIADGGIVLPIGARDPGLVPEPAGLGLLGLALLGLRRRRS